MSVGGSASKSNQKGSSTSVSTPNNPAWSQGLVQGVAEGASSLLGKNPWDFVSGANPMQTQAADGVAGLGGGTPMGPQSYQEALAGLRNITNGRSDYQSPYTDQVVNTSLADFDHNAANQRAAMSLRQAGAGAFGGSGAAIENAQFGGEMARGRASLDAGLRDTAFNTGANYGLQANAQKMNASNLIGQLGLANDASGQSQQGIDLQRLLAQFGMGSELRGIDQEQRQAPISLLERMAGVANGAPLGLFQGMTETGTSKGSGSSYGLSASYKAKSQQGD